MWNITSSVADSLFSLSNVVLIIGAVAVLVGTIGSIKMAGVREYFSNERISTNETETALANARALEAQLALEKFKAPRTLSPESQARIGAKLRPFAGTPFAFSVMPDPEPIALMNQIAAALVLAGWKPAHFPVKGGLQVSAPDGMNAGLITSFTGLQIEIPVARASEWEAPMLALLSALTADAGIEATAQRDIPGSEATTEALAIFIGKKP